MLMVVQQRNPVLFYSKLFVTGIVKLLHRTVLRYINFSIPAERIMRIALGCDEPPIDCLAGIAPLAIVAAAKVTGTEFSCVKVKVPHH